MKIMFKDLEIGQNFIHNKKRYMKIKIEQSSDCKCSKVNAINLETNKKVFFAKLLRVRIEDETK